MFLFGPNGALDKGEVPHAKSSDADERDAAKLIQTYIKDHRSELTHYLL